MGPMGLPNIPGMPAMSNLSMSAAVASMTAATMTAALTNMGALAAMPPLAPLPTITNKPPPSLNPPAPAVNLDHIEEAKRKVTHQANIHTIKELTELDSANEEPTVPDTNVCFVSVASSSPHLLTSPHCCTNLGARAPAICSSEVPLVINLPAQIKRKSVHPPPPLPTLLCHTTNPASPTRSGQVTSSSNSETFLSFHLFWEPE
ncbi:unnamed protein product [Tetraodon nigroviridis]|uniref:(spotted green pufferfish) hypothetical protein n=1 Tax=Tetraodon nigroviridis TaxID=99883 RepID=Q4RQR0_TETNG|nr:unnamed protein product [Tetraodon nigroviridis]